MEKTKKNVQKSNIYNHNIKYIKGNSYLDETENTFKKHLNNNKLDLLFIDGDHTYEE